VDAELVSGLIDRDWPMFVEQARRLELGEPTRTDLRIDIPVRPAGAEEDFLAVLLCEEYDAQAPILNFADPQDPSRLGASHWPRIDGAPMNSVPWQEEILPIVCVVGTRGYHVHSSHCTEIHPRCAWRLPVVATVIHRFLHMGPYRGRGV
jgi:hypothetical protein